MAKACLNVPLSAAAGRHRHSGNWRRIAGKFPLPRHDLGIDIKGGEKLAHRFDVAGVAVEVAHARRLAVATTLVFEVKYSVGLLLIEREIEAAAAQI